MRHIQYGGHDVIVDKVDSIKDLTLECKGRKILLSQLRQFTEIPSFRTKRLMAGIDQENRVPISESHNGNIKIGCLEDTKENFYSLFKILLDE
jgi:hypothetical protein